MHDKRNWFWGVFFILAAVFLLASQLGSFSQIGFVSLLATILLAAVLIKSAVKGEFFGILLSLALLYLIYQQPLGLAYISFWLLLLSAILLSIGLSCIFRNNSRRYLSRRREGCGPYGQHGETREDIDGNNPYVRVSFGASSKYLHGDCLSSGNFSVSFGALSVFFDQAILSPAGAQVELDCSFGEIKLFVPRSWRVVDQLRANLGGVENDTYLSQPEEGAPQLTVCGAVTMGSVEIHYI